MRCWEQAVIDRVEVSEMVAAAAESNEDGMD